MQGSTVIISGEPVLADNWENIELRGYHRESSEGNNAGKLEKKVYVMLTAHIVQDELAKFWSVIQVRWLKFCLLHDSGWIVSFNAGVQTN